MADQRVRVAVTGPGEPSGLATMLADYFEQNIRDFPDKSVQAQRIRGTLTIEAAEHDVGVTVRFTDGMIEITDGCAAAATMSVRGEIFALTQLATGGRGAWAHMARGDLTIRSAWKHPAFAFRVARFLRVPDAAGSGMAAAARALRWKLAAGAVLGLLGLAAYVMSR